MKKLDVTIIALLSFSIVMAGCAPSHPSGETAKPQATQSKDSTNPTEAQSNHGRIDEPTSLGVDDVAATTTTVGKETPGESSLVAREITFKDDVQSNIAAPSKLDELEFTDTNGDKIALADYQGKKNVVLVFTEGFNGILCPFCQTHTSRLIANYEKFQQLDTEILVVYPGLRDHVDEFIETALKTEKQQIEKVPFPIVLDEDYTAADFFEIRDTQPHPSTFVIDKDGKVQLAYVGKDLTADRPSVQAILGKVKSVNQ